MMTPEQLKGKIRSVAKEKSLSSQEILQMYLFERVIDRLSRTKYKDNLILKGGFLIASMIGVDARTTMDMDTTVKGLPMDEEMIAKVVKEILSVDVGDGIRFVFDRIAPIRENDDYNNYRVYFSAVFGKINNPMKIDITTGDEITPAAIEYRYRTMFSESEIPVMAYNLETSLAEKYETIIRRNIGTTRARDFYDLHELYRIHKENINVDVLKTALAATSEKRGSEAELAEWREICDDLRDDPVIKQLWDDYSDEYSYASSISYTDIIDSLIEFGESVSQR